MAATTIHIDPVSVTVAVAAAASLIVLVLLIVDGMIAKLSPKERAEVGRWERGLAAAFVVFLGIGPAYLIHLLSGGHCA